MLSSARSIASRFADALDAEDYSTAGALLAIDCLYSIRDSVIFGRDAVIDSYQLNGDSARRRFDAVEYSSQVFEIGLREARIRFMDRLRIADEWHEYACEQTVRIGPDGLIHEIKHTELPRQRELLAKFEAKLRRE
jgi:hypothetical protein